MCISICSPYFHQQDFPQYILHTLCQKGFIKTTLLNTFFFLCGKNNFSGFLNSFNKTKNCENGHCLHFHQQIKKVSYILHSWKISGKMWIKLMYTYDFFNIYNHTSARIIYTARIIFHNVLEDLFSILHFVLRTTIQFLLNIIFRCIWNCFLHLSQLKKYLARMWIK